MESVDKAIEAISNKIQSKTKEQDSPNSEITEMTNALAALVTARANLVMATRTYACGGTTLSRRNDKIQSRVAEQAFSIATEQIIESLTKKLGKSIGDSISHISETEGR